MILAKVKGNVVSTHKNEHLKGHKLMLIHPIDLNLEYIGKEDIIAIDLIDSGIGDIVIVTQEGDAVQQILGHANAPLHTIIVGIVDAMDIPKINI